MDDDNNKFDRPKGPRGPRPAGARGGKSYGDKPAGKGFGGKKPFVRDRAAADETGAKPFRKGPRPERAGDDARHSDDRPRFSRERSFSGEKRPYREKREFSKEGDSPRQRRESPGDHPPRASGERPFSKGPRSERNGEGERRPFREQRDTGDRPFRKEPRPAWRQDGERKPFVKRGGFEKAGDVRPGRFEREQARQADDDKPRSFGMKRHAEAGSKGGDRPRSYGQRSHDDAKRGAERPRTRRPEVTEESGERIAKRLARAGIASRREAEDLVAAGRVRVNGQVLSSPAFNVGPEDRIELDGNEIPAIERTRLFLFHKPAGVVTTNRDPEGRRTVFDVLPPNLPRLMTVGRLDINTEGLLLLTNDGGLARVLELPTTGWLRRYRVRVHGDVDEKALAGLKDGIAVDGVFYGAIDASLERVQGTNAWLTVGLREGKNREVKNVMGALGLEVTRLIRVSFGPFQLGDLPEGQVQELKGRTLRDQLGERLIEEAGANFDAPVTKPFSNKPGPARRTEEHPVRSVRGPAPLQVEPGEGGLIKGRKRRREDARADALGRLSTRPERGGFGDKPGFGGKRFDGSREKQGEDKPRPGQRKSNVWMAPGARPQGEGKAAPKGKPASKGASRPSSTGRGPSPRERGEGKGPRGPRKG